MIRTLRALLMALVGGYVAFFALQVGFTRFFAPSKPPPKAAHIVVLSHTYMYQLKPRIQIGAELFNKSAAQSLIVTGENIAPLMAEMAQKQGVPTEYILQEPKAKSTLQNALFVREMLPRDGAPLVLVSDQSHLLRAWVSFRWAGFSEVHLRASTSPRWELPDSALEAGKWLYNLSRMAAASALHALGVTQGQYSWLLE